MAKPRPDSIACPARNGLPARRRQRVVDRELTLESELSDDLGITDEELDAIGRLLGDDLKAMLSGA